MTIEKVKLSEHWSFDRSAVIGAGGYGTVFRITSSPREGDFCIKVTPISKEYVREADIVKKLQCKTFEHIVPIIDSGFNSDEKEFLFVMPLGDQSLQDYIVEAGPLSELETATILLEVITGLDEADLIIHRDIKPSNIIRIGSKWRIADFGVSKFAPDRPSKHTLRGPATPSYAAPELWESGLPITKAVDIYALGCVGLYLLNCSLPFYDKSLEVLSDQHRYHLPPLDINRNSSLNAILQRMLMKFPNERGTPSELSGLLKVFIETNGAGDNIKENLNRVATRYIRQREKKIWNSKKVAEYAETWEDDIRTEKENWLIFFFDKYYKKVKNTIPFRSTKNGALFTFVGSSMEYKFVGKSTKATDEFKASFSALGKRTISAATLEIVDHDTSSSVYYSFWCRAISPAEENFEWEVVTYTQGGSLPIFVESPKSAAKAEASGIFDMEASKPVILKEGVNDDLFSDHLAYVLGYAIESSLDQNSGKLEFLTNTH